MLITGGSLGTSQSSSTYFVEDKISRSEGRVLHESHSLPAELGASGGCIDSFGQPLILGGWDGDRTSDLFLSFDVERGWTTLAPLHRPICYAAACTSIEGNIIISGGGSIPYRDGDVYDEVSINRYHKFNLLPSQSDVDGSIGDRDALGEASWMPLPSLLKKRCGHSAVTLFDDSIVVMGGYAGGVEYLSSVELFDWGSMSWYELPQMSVPRSGLAAVVGSGGSIYVAGGSPDGTIGTNTLNKSKRLSMTLSSFQIHRQGMRLVRDLI